MDNIFATLVQAIEESAYPIFSAQEEYRQEQHRAQQHSQWLGEHLDEEEKAHLEALRQAELRITSLECEAEVRLALAAGIRLTLPN